MARDESAQRVMDALARSIAHGSGFTSVRVRLRCDGTMHFALAGGDAPVTLLWREAWTGHGIEAPVGGGNGVVAVQQSPELEPGRRLALRAVCVHVALKLEHGLRDAPSDLLLWRNREPKTLYWGARLLGRLCPGLLAKGHTRYFDYHLTEVDEYEGAVNLTFESRERKVRLRWTLRDLIREQPLVAWGPLALTVLEDERTTLERELPAHQVEHFVGYVLSRNLPPSFRLTFERGDPPAGHLPEDFNVDLLDVVAPDDSSWFHMLFASSEDVAIATLCDRECFNLFSFVSAPPERWLAYAPWRLPPVSDLFSRIFQVSLSGDAALLGQDRTERCLESISASTPRPELVVLIDSCLSRLVGEDVDGAAARYRARRELPLVLYDIRLVQEPYLGQLSRFWAQAHRAVKLGETSPTPGRIGCFGVDVSVGGELESLIGAVGLEVGARLFPRFAVRDLRALSSCATIVFNQWLPVTAMSAALAAELERPSLSLPLPFGFDATAQWLDAVSRAAGGDGADALLQSDEVTRIREQFESAVQQIRGSRIGVFCRHAGLEQLTAEHRYGVDLLAVLRELSLGIDLNLFVADGETFEPTLVQERLGLDPARGDSIHTLSSWRELVPRLRAGDFPLAYTETYRDARVTHAGKLPWSLGMLRPGLRGALDGARALAALLRCQFYTRYSRYVSAPYAHYRTTVGPR